MEWERGCSLAASGTASSPKENKVALKGSGGYFPLKKRLRGGIFVVKCSGESRFHGGGKKLFDVHKMRTHTIRRVLAEGGGGIKNREGGGPLLLEEKSEESRVDGDTQIAQGGGVKSSVSNFQEKSSREMRPVGRRGRVHSSV